MSGSQVPNPHRDTINADRISDKKFICDDCEHQQLAFDETHTKMHTIVRVSKKGEENQISVEERLRLVEDELAKMRQLLVRLVGKNGEGFGSLGGGRQENEWGKEGYFSATRRMIQHRFRQENWIPQA